MNFKIKKGGRYMRKKKKEIFWGVIAFLVVIFAVVFFITKDNAENAKREPEYKSIQEQIHDEQMLW